MTQQSNRRTFMAGTALSIGATAALGVGRTAYANANEVVRLGVVGCGGRGSGVARQFASERNCDVVVCCDPDSIRAGKLAEALSKVNGQPRPAIVGDPRQVFDNANVDAVLVATPDHWHAPASIMACNAGKHVYVEKPCSHNLREGRLLVEAARRNKCVVQHGTQSRSMPIIAKAMQMLREGIIGDVLMAKAWNVQRRGNIGKGKPGPVPNNVDYDLWLGPAPVVPFQSNRFHYNWHWWHAFGTGDMGNDGVHEIDYARWGLGVESHPSRISGSAAKLFFDDDQQFPDTMQMTFEYPGDGSFGKKRILIWEMRIWSTNYPYNVDNGAEFYGTQGRLMVTKRGKLEVFGERNKRIESPSPKSDLKPLLSHHVDFLDAIPTGRRTNADIGIGHLSSSLCHLGNIVARTGRAIEFDPIKETVSGDKQAEELLSRRYRDKHWAKPAGV